MGRIWSDQRRFETWLQVEIAAAEAMAEAGIIPADAAREIREQGRLRRRADRGDRGADQARRDRLHDRGRRARRAIGPLVALRPHLLGRHRHRAGAADARGVRRHPRGPGRAACRHPAARGGAPDDPDDRPDARRPRRADHLRPQTGAVVCGGAARRRPGPARAGRHQRGQALGRGGDVRAPRPVDRSGRLLASRPRGGPRLVAGDPARSPRGTVVGPRDYGGVAREVRARDPGPAEDRNRRGGGAVRQGAEGLVGDAAQAQPDRVRAGGRPRAAAPRERDGRRWRTSRCGTSGTSRIHRSSG